MNGRNLLCRVTTIVFIFWLAAPPCCALSGQAKPAAPAEEIERDWMLQDAGKDAAKCFGGAAGAALEARMVARVLAELNEQGAALRRSLDQLTGDGVPGSDARWRELYLKACALRRRRRLARLVAKYPRIVFTKHYNIGGSHYAYTEGQSDAQAERHFRPGTALCILELGLDAPATARTLIEDPNGVIRDPDVSHDGRRILFAWKKSDRKDDYHLYDLDVATGTVRQLTFGLGYADYEGCYLPNGEILFNSTRCVQIVDCWWTEVSNLYTCDKDGRFLRRLSFDQVHTNYPQVMDDGRVIYTRWDYNDRGQLFPQPLFQMNPDGTAQTEYYGNNSWFPTTIMHARGIPGTGKIVTILSGHHSHQRGKLAIIDPGKGRQEADGVQLIAPIRQTKAVRVDAYGQSGEQFQYPYPLNETEFIVTYDPSSLSNRRYVRPFGIYYMDIDGRRELLAWDAKISCNQPVPLAPRRRPAVRPSPVDYRKNTGTFYVQDVYVGPGLAGIPRGTVKCLRVVALEYRVAGIGSNRNGGPAGGALVSTPVSADNGTWDVKKVLGSVKVHEDGSALFTVPARTPLYFQLLDDKDHVVQSMRSWSTLQPGEVFSCVGCHESKQEASRPARTITQALRQSPQAPEPFYGPPQGFSFPKMIQPILDKHCIRCHNDRSVSIGGKRIAASFPSTGATAIVPLESSWLYVTENPGKGWQNQRFDVSKWRPGRAGFGVKGTPGGKIHTEWKARNIHLRKTFTLPSTWRAEGKVFGLRLSHDDDVRVYLNGRQVFRAGGHTTKPLTVPVDATALKGGLNVLAVHCRAAGGGQFIDVSLLEAKPSAGAKSGKDKKAFSLLDERTVDRGARRLWSDAYLALTQRGRPNKIVNWLNAQSIPPMLPPYYAGAAKSKLITMLEEGHNDVKLSRQEMAKIACWIDLLVPFCGDYTEANAWNDAEKSKHARYQAKRDAMADLDRRNIEALIAYQNGGSLPPAPGSAAASGGRGSPGRRGPQTPAFPRGPLPSRRRAYGP